MTVLQIVKGLIGEEDVSWGDSDTTFSRQTHTGGSTTIHYIDSKSIPANTLGGVIDTHLHTQNTDTGTTATTFVINSGGNSATLSSAGLAGDRTYTFPLTAQALAGASNLASTSASYGASMVGIQDSTGNFSSTTVEGALGELAVSVAGQTEFRGYKRGFKLGYSSTTAVTISGGMWDHRGTTNQNVYTASQLTFTLGSAGSNSGSTNLGASELHYIYIDDSAVVTAGTALLTASEFLNSTTAPAWSNTKCGWYSGNDRCVGAILTTAASAIVEFFVRSNNFYAYTAATAIVAFSSAAAPTSYTNLDLSGVMPVFSTCAHLDLNPATADHYLFGINGGHNAVTTLSISGANVWSSTDVYTDTAQILEWDSMNGVVTVILLRGFYIDEL